MVDSFNDKIQRLIKRAKDGDREALDELFGGDRPEQVLWIVRKRMGNELRREMESTDLVNDVFLSAIPSLENCTFESEEDFLRWLASIVENRIRDHADKIHAKKRDKRKEIPLNSNRRAKQDSVVGVTGPVTWTTPSRIVSKKEDLDKLKKAMDELRPEYKEVIELKIIKGLSHKEIAKRLNKSSHSTRSLLSRAMAALTEVMVKSDGRIV